MARYLRYLPTYLPTYLYRNHPPEEETTSASKRTDFEVCLPLAIALMYNRAEAVTVSHRGTVTWITILLRPASLEDKNNRRAGRD